MIRIRYTRDADGHRLHITGHAGHAPRGQDIVCAGVSALALALTAYLRQRTPALRCRTACGELLVCCPAGEGTDAAFAMALTGLQSIAKTYPPWVEVDISPSGQEEEKEREAR